MHLAQESVPGFLHTSFTQIYEKILNTSSVVYACALALVDMGKNSMYIGAFS
jgi:hypothetical protein